MTTERNAPEVTQLYQEISEELRQLLVRKMGNTRQADEIAQNTYLKLCRLKHSRDISNLRGYLFNMAVGIAINHLQKHRLIDGCRAERACLVLKGELKTEAIKRSITELSDKTRYIFLLHRYRGLRYSAIAKHMAVPVSAIESHMNLALGNIKDAMKAFSAPDNRGCNRDVHGQNNRQHNGQDKRQGCAH